MVRMCVLVLTCASPALGLMLPTTLPRRVSPVRLAADDEEVDWREMRARLVAQEKQAASSVGSGYVYESPLIEQAPRQPTCQITPQPHALSILNPRRAPFSWVAPRWNSALRSASSFFTRA
jgi:hypothetical protein